MQISTNTSLNWAWGLQYWKCLLKYHFQLIPMLQQTCSEATNFCEWAFLPRFPCNYYSTWQLAMINRNQSANRTRKGTKKLWRIFLCKTAETHKQSLFPFSKIKTVRILHQDSRARASLHTHAGAVCSSCWLSLFCISCDQPNNSKRSSVLTKIKIA